MTYPEIDFRGRVSFETPTAKRSPVSRIYRAILFYLLV